MDILVSYRIVSYWSLRFIVYSFTVDFSSPSPAKSDSSKRTDRDLGELELLLLLLSLLLFLLTARVALEGRVIVDVTVDITVDVIVDVTVDVTADADALGLDRRFSLTQTEEGGGLIGYRRLRLRLPLPSKELEEKADLRGLPPCVC